MIRRISLVLAAGAALFLGATASASAGTLDQQQTASDSDGGLFSDQSLAQTFTPSATGRLDQVDVALDKFGSPPGPSVTVEIRGTSAGTPDASPLATASIPISSVGTTQAFLSATFASPASVTAGTKYAIVVYSPGAAGNAIGIGYQSADVYSGGAAFLSTQAIPPGSVWTSNGTSDLAFKTYVAPPAASPPANTGQPAKKKKCKKKGKKGSAQSAKKKCKKKKKK